MTNPLIPHAFVPGTKAKANEVNANFLSLAKALETYKFDGSQNLNELSDELTQLIELKADKTELKDIYVEDADTNLDTYKTKGTYIFSEEVKPTGLPEKEKETPYDAAGTLIVRGKDAKSLNQIWFSDCENKPIFMRDYDFVNSTWKEWLPLMGKSVSNTAGWGYVILPNGLIVQWGVNHNKNPIYPIAYGTFYFPYATKLSMGWSCTRSDTGFTALELSSHYFDTAGAYGGHYWMTIGM